MSWGLFFWGGHTPSDAQIVTPGYALRYCSWLAGPYGTLGIKLRSVLDQPERQMLYRCTITMALNVFSFFFFKKKTCIPLGIFLYNFNFEISREFVIVCQSMLFFLGEGLMAV